MDSDNCLVEIDHPEFEDLGKKTKYWMIENGTCLECKRKLNQNFPHCECVNIKALRFDFDLYISEFSDIYSYESKRQDSRYYNKIYKDRKKRADGFHTKEDIQEIYSIQNKKCYYCLSDIETFAADHINALVNGGTNWPENIACACKKCNSLKSDNGKIAFWNSLKEIHGKELVEQAKLLAKQQNKRKREISGIRKKQIEDIYLLSKNYRRLRSFFQDILKNDVIKESFFDCQQKKIVIFITRYFAFLYSKDILLKPVVKLKKKEIFDLYVWSIICLASIIEYMKQDLNDVSDFRNRFYINDLHYLFYSIEPFNIIQNLTTDFHYEVMQFVFKNERVEFSNIYQNFESFIDNNDPEEIVRLQKRSYEFSSKVYNLNKKNYKPSASYRYASEYNSQQKELATKDITKIWDDTFSS